MNEAAVPQMGFVCVKDKSHAPAMIAADDLPCPIPRCCGEFMSGAQPVEKFEDIAPMLKDERENAGSGCLRHYTGNWFEYKGRVLTGPLMADALGQCGCPPK